uniref:Microtubule associated tumor suppressor 1b n=1 Tax=Iconisemion striatum TaxID=60296 RepID=A0A1A7YE64_9TELE
MCVTLTQVSTGVFSAVAEPVVDDKNSMMESVGPQAPLDSPQDHRESSQMFSSKDSACDASAVPPPPPDEAEIHKAQTKPAPKPKNAAVKPSSQEAKRLTKLDLRPVQNKTGARSNTSPSKTTCQTKPAPVGGRKPALRKEEGDGNKKPLIKVAVLKPIRTKNPNPKASHKMAATSNPDNPENRKLAFSRTFSDGSLGSEVEGEGPPNAPKMAVQEKDLGSKGPDGASVLEEKQNSPVRKVSSRIGPGTRQPTRTTRIQSGPTPPLDSGTRPPGPSLTDNSTSGEAGQSSADGSLIRSRQNQNQNQGIPRPRPSSEQPSAPSPTGSALKPAANQQPAAGSAGRLAASSRLPVKGLTTSLGPGPGSGPAENNATSKAAPEPPTGPKPDERPSRATLPPTKHPGSGSTAPSSSTSPPTDHSAAPKPPAARTRTLSLQARTPATGLKSPTASIRSPCGPLKAPPPGFPKPTAPLQRNGSARFSRPNGSVDKNRTREAPARPSSTSTSSQVAAGHQQNQHLSPAESVPDVLNANIPVKPAVPEPGSDAASTTSTGPTGSGFKTRTGSRCSPKTGPRLQNASRPGVGGAVATEGTVGSKQNQNKEQLEKKNQAIVQLRRILVQGNRKVEALAVVIQQLFTEREETLKKKKELSLELGKLRDELVASSQKCERLQREKEETRSSVEEALKRLEVQHQEELVQLEDRLRSFYQTEWDKVHQVYQEEADRCRTLMDQQVEELRVRQEEEKKNQEEIHSQKMESLKQDHETSLQELKRIQQTDLEDLQKTMKETEASLSEKISELSAEREDLSEKLRAEEERRQRILSDRNLKDSHTVYLQQELESLKVVLEMKNNQLHQKEKKLMEMDRLVETNVRLEECLNKVQQENEDYQARMDKHAALSKQLSTEQALLQQTLQKESKVNKRLSMENEELLWKLHNGDLMASPRHLSPTSPFGSPRNSASFPTAAPLSPR